MKTLHGKNKFWEIYTTECLTCRYVQKLLKTRSTVLVQLDHQSWKKYRTFQKYSVERPWEFWLRKMHNFYEAFEEIKFKDWISLRTWKLQSQSMKFLWTIKGNKKKNIIFASCLFLYTFYWFLLQIILLYTITTHRWTYNAV